MIGYLVSILIFVLLWTVPVYFKLNFLSEIYHGNSPSTTEILRIYSAEVSIELPFPPQTDRYRHEATSPLSVFDWPVFDGASRRTEIAPLNKLILASKSLYTSLTARYPRYWVTIERHKANLIGKASPEVAKLVSPKSWFYKPNSCHQSLKR